MWAIVPVKTFDRAKQRLANVLSEDERRSLMLAMARDVLTCLSTCSNLSGILIVSRAPEADALAQTFATERFAESPDANLPESLEQATQHLVKHFDAQGVIVVPADAGLSVNVPDVCSASSLVLSVSVTVSAVIVMAPAPALTSTSA